MRPLGGAARSPSGYIRMSPFGSGSVLKPSGTSTGVPSKNVQRLPALVPEAKQGLAAAQPDHVHPERVQQIGRDLAQHLVRLDDLHRRAGRVELQRLPQQVDRCACMPVTALAPDPAARDPAPDG